MSDVAMEWGPDDPTKMLAVCPEMLYERCRGSAGKRMWSPGFARVALERLGGQ